MKESVSLRRTVLYFVILKVEPPLKEDINLASLDDMVSGSGSMLDDLVTNGDPQKALALAAVVSSVLNHVDHQAGNTTGNLTDEEISKSREESQKIDKVRIKLKTLQRYGPLAINFSVLKQC